MSSLDDYYTVLGMLEKESPEKLITPKMPIKDFVQEAMNLHVIALQDADKICNQRVTMEDIEKLKIYAGALRHAEAEWFLNKNEKSQAKMNWDSEARLAYNFRNKLLKFMKYAFAGETHLLEKVKYIRSKTGHPDMIQDLHTIHQLGYQNKGKLESFGIDIALLDTAREKAIRLAELLAMVESENDQMRAYLVTRNKIHTLLYLLISEVRAAGRFAFNDNPARYKRYINSYRQQRNKKGKKR